MAADQSAQNHVFARVFWLLRHYFLLLFSEICPVSDQFISKLGDFIRHVTVSFGEKVGVYRWSAVIAGLTGVVIITDPFSRI